LIHEIPSISIKLKEEKGFYKEKSINESFYVGWNLL
jgi:hypothetical protein